MLGRAGSKLALGNTAFGKCVSALQARLMRNHSVTKGNKCKERLGIHPKHEAVMNSLLCIGSSPHDTCKRTQSMNQNANASTCHALWLRKEAKQTPEKKTEQDKISREHMIVRVWRISVTPRPRPRPIRDPHQP